MCIRDRLRRQTPRARWHTPLTVLILLLLMAGGGRDASIDRSGEWAAHDYAAVSYTHLTLPTSDLV